MIKSRWKGPLVLAARAVLAGVAAATPFLTGQAEQVHDEEEHQNALEFARQYERVKNPKDIEEKIVAIEAALAAERKIQTWPFPVPRWRYRTFLLNALGIAYQERIKGDRADNFEGAVTALEAQLAETGRETSPRDWANAQNNLSVAYSNHPRGERADNVERAIRASQAPSASTTAKNSSKIGPLVRTCLEFSIDLAYWAKALTTSTTLSAPLRNR